MLFFKSHRVIGARTIFEQEFLLTAQVDIASETFAHQAILELRYQAHAIDRSSDVLFGPTDYHLICIEGIEEAVIYEDASFDCAVSDFKLMVMELRSFKVQNPAEIASVVPEVALKRTGLIGIDTACPARHFEVDIFIRKID